MTENSVPPPCCPNCHAPIPSLLLKVSQVAYLLDESRRSVSDRLRKFQMRWKPMGKKGKHKRVPFSEVNRFAHQGLVGSDKDLLRISDARRKG